MADTDQAVEEKTEGTQAQSAEFSEAVAGANTGAGSSIDILLDMSIPVTVAIGKREISIQKLLQLGPGSVLQLDKPIDMPADLYLRDTKFATGDIVVVDGQFAVKIKDILGAGTPAGAEDEQPAEAKG